MNDLDDRVARLEHLVEELREELRAKAGNAPAEEREAVAPKAPAPAPTASRAPRDWMQLGEDWLGRIGVLLLLLGLAFLYRYAVDQGWITPWLRVTFGLLLGAGGLTVGLRQSGRRPLYGAVLLGGAVAVLYLTGWAAGTLYGLVPWSAGFAFMGAVTVLALVLAGRRAHQTLAVIGAAGGLATPFLLQSPRDDVIALVAYAVLVLAWAGALQLRRGWGVLLAVNVVGGMAVMAAAAGMASSGDSLGARVAAQVGILCAWTVACALPFLLARLHQARPERWPSPPSNRALLWGLAVAGSFVAAGLSTVAWDFGRFGMGLAVLVAAGTFLAGRRFLPAHSSAAFAALDAGALLLVIGTAIAAGSEWLPVPVAIEAAALLGLAAAGSAGSLRTLAHVVFALLLIQFVAHLGQEPDGLVTPYPAGVLGAIALAAAGGWSYLTDGSTRRLYFAFTYLAFLAWLAWVLTPLAGGHGLTSAAWGLCGMALLFVGARRAERGVRLAGLGTLGVVVAKLLVVDLSALEPGVRIVLFLGFGGVFLLLGYLFKGRDEADAPSP